MAFKFSEAHIAEYFSQGFTVFRGILPPALMTDLRKVTDRGRELVRKEKGPQYQRFQPVCAYDIDQKPFENYRDLPELRDAIARVLSPKHTHGSLKYLGVLVEPADRPECTNWHRDWVHHNEPLTFDACPLDIFDLNNFNQINCALYEDGCTWVVPGSHFRKDLPAEETAFSGIPAAWPNLKDLSDAAAERAGLEYCRRMPGSQQLLLNAGDLAMYRNIMWHLGNYAPYRKRATLHDSAMTTEYIEWMNKVKVSAAKQPAKGTKS